MSPFAEGYQDGAASSNFNHDGCRGAFRLQSGPSVGIRGPATSGPASEISVRDWASSSGTRELCAVHRLLV